MRVEKEVWVRPWEVVLMPGVAEQRGPLMVSLDTTYRCNLKCLHCFNLSNTPKMLPEMSDEELLATCEQLAEIQPSVVCFCGGEPLLRRNVLYEACESMIRQSKGNTRVNMVTNGLLIDREVAAKLRTAGLNMVQVSLDGARPGPSNRTNQGVRAVRRVKSPSLASASGTCRTLKFLRTCR